MTDYSQFRTDIKKPKTDNRYPNTSQHPEYQSTETINGYHSVLLKQLELNEKILRALLDVQITNLSKSKQEEMIIKYKELF